VLGTAVMLPDPVMGGIAVALIFGSLSSAALAVVVVPLLYRAFAVRHYPTPVARRAT